MLLDVRWLCRRLRKVPALLGLRRLLLPRRPRARGPSGALLHGSCGHDQSGGRRKVFDAHLDQDTIEAGLEPEVPEVEHQCEAS